MAMLRMSMGQKHSAKNVTKVAFAETPESPTASASLGLQPSPSRRSSLGSSASSGSERGGAKMDFITKLTTGSLKTSEDDIDEGTAPIASLALDSTMVSPFRRHFNLVMGALIIINTIFIAIETDAGYDPGGAVEDKIGWIVVDTIFIVIFLGEIFIRMRWEGICQWVRSAWNWADVIIVLMAMVDIWVLTWLAGDLGSLHILSIFRIIRLARLVRLVKLVRLLHSLYVVLMAFWHAMQTMSFLLAMMMFGMMIYAILAVNLIGRNTELQDIRINGDTVGDRFGTVYKSMYSLFELMTLEGWEQVARPIVSEQPMLFFFIVSFIMIFTFGMLNMIVALVIDKTLHHTRLMGDHMQGVQRGRMAEELRRIHEYFGGDGDKSAADVITVKELETCLRESQCVQQILDRMGVTPKDALELYTVLDWDESGELTIDELLEGLAKLQEGVCSAWDAMATHSFARSACNKVSAVQETVERVVKEQYRLKSSLADQQRWLMRIEASMDSQSQILQRILSSVEGPRSDGCGSSPKLQDQGPPTTSPSLTEVLADCDA